MCISWLILCDLLQLLDNHELEHYIQLFAVAYNFYKRKTWASWQLFKKFILEAQLYIQNPYCWNSVKGFTQRVRDDWWKYNFLRATLIFSANATQLLFKAISQRTPRNISSARSLSYQLQIYMSDNIFQLAINHNEITHAAQGQRLLSVNIALQLIWLIKAVGALVSAK